MVQKTRLSVKGMFQLMVRLISKDRASIRCAAIVRSLVRIAVTRHLVRWPPRPKDGRLFFARALG